MDVRRSWAITVISIGLAHCGPAAPPAYREVQAIYTTSCAIGRSCHGTMGVQPVLVEGMSHAATVNVNATQIAMPLIAPGNPDNSYLWHKINGTMRSLPQCSMRDCGARMPMVGGTALSDAQLDTIRRWILAGAPSQ